MSNSFGRFFKIHSFGESHGTAMGVVIEGVPAGVDLDLELLHRELQRRRPGQSALVSARSEDDQPEILSGIFEGKSLGTPIAVLVRNKDQRSQDYDLIKQESRRGHADDVWKIKYGHVDHRGGGRSSGRETLSRVIAGAFAKMLLQQLAPDLKILSYSQAIGPYSLTVDEEAVLHKQQSFGVSTPDSQSLRLLPTEAKGSGAIQAIEANPLRFPTPRSSQVETELQATKEAGDSWGGVVATYVTGVQPGLGEPVFAKLKSELASAMMSVGASCSFELGLGLEATRRWGQDLHRIQADSVYGGIRGGISTGDPIYFRVGFKPTSSILDVAKKGRHDPCIVPRAVPVIEAMTALVLADQLLAKRLNQA